MSVTLRQTSSRAGILLGVAEVVYGIFFRVGGFHFTSIWGWGFYLMLPGAIWWAQRGYRRQEGALSYRQGLAIGTLTTSIGSAIYCVQVWLYNRFVDDSLLASVREYQLALFEERGLTGATLESATRQLEFFLLPAGFAVGVFVHLMLYSIAFTLVIALINRRRGGTTSSGEKA